MADPRRQLSELAARVDAAVDEGSLASERAVQLRAAEPLVDVLGWDVRDDEVRPEVPLGDGIVDYLLEVDGDAAIAIVTAPPEADLSQVANEELRPKLDAALVPRGIATDGRGVVLLARSDGTVYDHAFPFGELADHTDALGRFHRSSLEATLADSQAIRRDAARRLAAEKESVASAVTEDVLEVTGTEASDVVSQAVDRLVDDLVDALAPEGAEVVETERPSGASQSERSEQSGTPEARSEFEGDGDGSTTSGSEIDGPGGADGATEPATDPAGDQESVTDGAPDANGIDDSDGVDDGDGSYVARFFGGSSSVGAVGTGSPRSTTVGVVRYLLENQELHRSVTFPWEVEPGEPVVADSRPAPGWIALENPDVTDVFVRPIDDPDAAKAAIEGLADAVGLRVMFQGDW